MTLDSSAELDALITIYGNNTRTVTIKTPFSFLLTPDEAAEIVREFWEKTIVPVQEGLKSSCSASYLELAQRLRSQSHQGC